jgi:hypothetical protein
MCECTLGSYLLLAFQGRGWITRVMGVLGVDRVKEGGFALPTSEAGPKNILTTVASEGLGISSLCELFNLCSFHPETQPTSVRQLITQF